MSTRRDFITLLGGAAVAWPISAQAQQPAMPVVGFVSSRSLAGSARHAAAFSKGLSETGSVEAQNVMVAYHWLEGQNDRLSVIWASTTKDRWPSDGIAQFGTEKIDPCQVAARSGQAHDKT